MSVLCMVHISHNRCGAKDVTSHMRYGVRHRKQRRWIHKAFTDKAAVMQLRPLVRREMYIMLSGLIDTPDNVLLHFKRCVRMRVRNRAVS